MAILMDHTAPNGAKGNYFRINRVEGIFAPREPVPRWEIWVGFYASQEIRAENSDPIMGYRVNVPFSALPADPRTGGMAGFYSVIKDYAPFAGNTVQDVVEDSPDLGLDVEKALKKEGINTARLAANSGSFPYQGKFIACDALSRGDLDGVANKLALTGTFPDGFPNAWKATDDTYLPIPDAAAFAALYSAMTAQGASNFGHAQALKALVDSATTVDQVRQVTWDTPT